MRRLPIVAALLALCASPALAQRSLHWREIDVDATLDSSGRLHVRERQSIVFTGDWNGGQRRFNIRPRQDFGFQSMRRVDAVDGERVMRSGTLDVVDGYDFIDESTLRWRSRTSADPPFDNTVITYILEYSIGRVLQPDGDQWVLDHDFAFSDREGIVERLNVRLALDSTWRPTMAYAGAWSATNLPPGEGFVVRVPMRYVGTGDGPDVSTGADPAERGLLAIITLVLLSSFGARLYRRERESGRLDPLLPVESIDRAWLEEHVFSQLPEVVGAAWDNTTGASEVAATLARLVAEGRMSSKVVPGGLLKEPSLHLVLLVDRDRFHGHERALIDALFDDGATTTDTQRISARYKRSGFDPAEKIKKPIAQMVAALAADRKARKAPAWPTAMALLIAAALLVAGGQREEADIPIAIVGLGLALFAYFISVIGAAFWRNRVHGLARSAFWFIVPLAIVVGLLLWILATGFTQGGILTMAGLAALVVALANSVGNQARTRESGERIALRRRLAAARQYFVAQLRLERPALEDKWFPYLIAFGLGKQMDKWFHAFAGEGDAIVATGAVGATSYSSGSSGGSHSPSGGWTGFGGGGGFSGGGASASWVAAATSMSAGVSAPGSSSSSGGGGGGGGGGSSGGGGGGGW